MPFFVKTKTRKAMITSHFSASYYFFFFPVTYWTYTFLCLPLNSTVFKEFFYCFLSPLPIVTHAVLTSSDFIPTCFCYSFTLICICFFFVLSPPIHFFHFQIIEELLILGSYYASLFIRLFALVLVIQCLLGAASFPALLYPLDDLPKGSYLPFPWAAEVCFFAVHYPYLLLSHLPFLRIMNLAAPLFASYNSWNKMLIPWNCKNLLDLHCSLPRTDICVIKVLYCHTVLTSACLC